jgi:TATA-box binding protein (TBP) (component of TFIID and TFIIIB)
MTSINNPSGRIKFKDIRKITIGISKKDIMTYRSKKKQAFYNCFVMILRIKINELFKEFHIKVFNTGKLEIPGVQNDEIFEIVLTNIVNILQPLTSNKISYKQTSDTVLINSNFNCGFYINREVLYDILKYKYHIQAIYDPCSYPGIQCKFCYNDDITEQSGRQITLENKDKFKNITEVSFMIFRTGSVLIVGMCSDEILFEIYEFLKTLLKTEFKAIFQKMIPSDTVSNKNKKRKIRKKNIIVTSEPPTSDTNKNNKTTNLIFELIK